MTVSRMSPVEPAAARENGTRRPSVEIVVSVPTVVKAVGIFFALLLAYLVRDALLSESVAADAAKNLPSAAVNLLGAAAGIVGSVFSLVTLTFLTLFGLLAKPQLTQAGLQLMRPQHAARFDRILGEVCNAVSERSSPSPSPPR